MASNELQDTLDRILLEKNVKLIPENIKKGVTIFGVTGNATIDMTDATATVDDIVNGKTAYLKDGIATGTMVNNGAVYITPSQVEQPIPTGYHNGNGKVRAVSSSVDSNIKANNIKKGVTILGITGTLDALDTSDATANASTILSGNTAYVNGHKITGIMANNGKLNITPRTYSQNFGSGYYSGVTAYAVTSDIDSNIKAGNIKQGVTILGVVGNLSDTGIDTSDATANASRILNGYTAYINAEKVTGNMPNRGSWSVTPRTYSQSGSAGYYSGISIGAVTSSIDSNIKAENIKQGVSILGVAGTLISQDIDKITETITPRASSDIVRNNIFYNKLTVAKVTSNVDDNIQPRNILKGITILGVEGALEQDVVYEAGTLTVWSSKYVNYSPAWVEGTITESFCVEDRETGDCTITDKTGDGYVLLRCYFNLMQSNDLVFEYEQDENTYAVFSTLDNQLPSGRDISRNVYFNTRNQTADVVYEDVQPGVHFVDVKVFSSAVDSQFKFRPVGTNVKQKIVSQVYASTDAMNLDKSQTVGTYGFIFSLVDNTMVEVYRFNGIKWVRQSIGDYEGSLEPADFSKVLKQIDKINGEEIV